MFVVEKMKWEVEYIERGNNKKQRERIRLKYTNEGNNSFIFRTSFRRLDFKAYSSST